LCPRARDHVRGAANARVPAFALLVAGTCTYAVVLAREEQEHREHELAEHEAEVSEEEAVGEPAADPESEATEEEGGAAGENLDAEDGEATGQGETIELSSPEDGSLVFDPETLEGSAGTVTIDYTNPSAVPHNVALEVEGETVAEGDVVSGGDISSVSFELEPGTYVFYCSVPGHREGGMEGELTIR
jgi:plastocyanin